MRETGKWSIAPAVVGVAILFSVSPVEAQGQHALPPKATLYLSVHSNAARAAESGLESALSELGEDARFARLGALLEPVEPQRMRLKAAAEGAQQGKKMVRDLEVREGLKMLRDAAQLEEELFHLVSGVPDGVQAHGRLLAELAIAYFLDGNAPEARSTLQRAFVLLSTMEYDAQLFPPQMKRLFNEARAVITSTEPGELQVTTRPAPAVIHVDGAFAGVSPLTAQGLVRGRHLITATAHGYQTRTIAVEVLGQGNKASLDVELAPLEGKPAELLVLALQKATLPRGAPELQQVSERLGVDVLFLAEARSQGETAHVQLYLYDARTRQVTGRAIGTIVVADPTPGSRALISAMVPLLPYRPPPPVVVAPAQESWFARFRRSQYFWPVVGTVAASLLGVSLGLGIYYGTHNDADHARRVLILPVVP